MDVQTVHLPVPVKQNVRLFSNWRQTMPCLTINWTIPLFELATAASSKFRTAKFPSVGLAAPINARLLHLESVLPRPPCCPETLLSTRWSRWSRAIGNGDPGYFGSSAIPGRPLVRAGVTSSVRCEGSTWQQIAKENGFRSYVYDTSSPATDERTMCRHNDGRDNYTSCHDNKHFDWNGTDWVIIPACTDSWTTRLTVYDPVPANFPTA